MAETAAAVGSTLTFGVDPVSTLGVVQSYGENDSAEIAEAKDESGKTIAQKAYSKNKEIQIEVLVLSSITLPKVGTPITLNTESYLISAISKTKSNTDYYKANITASKKDSATLIALT